LETSVSEISQNTTWLKSKGFILLHISFIKRNVEVLGPLLRWISMILL